MRDTDPFDAECLSIPDGPEQAPAPVRQKRHRGRPRKADRFLKGPVPWSWLARAMAMAGEALAVGVGLWLRRGIMGRAAVPFCLAHAVAEGIPRSTAHRALGELEQAGLVAVRRRPGCGYEVTLLDGG